MLESLEKRYKFVLKFFPFLDFLFDSGNINTFWVTTFYVIKILSLYTFTVLLVLNMHLLASVFVGSAVMAHSYNIYFIQEFWRQALCVDTNKGKINLFLYKNMWLIETLVKVTWYFSVFTGNIPFIIFSILCYSIIFVYSYYKWNNR